MNHAPGTVLIAQPVDLQSTMPLCYGYPLHSSMKRHYNCQYTYGTINVLVLIEQLYILPENLTLHW